MEYKWVVLSNTTLGVLMSSLDMNIVLIALPTIGSHLAGMNTFDVLWVILGYQLVIASFLVNFGRLSDIFGRVKLYNIGFAIFTLGSGLCSIAQTADELIGFRLVQAIGSAFLFSNSAAIITDAFPANERGKALGINQVSIVVGSVTGLVLGGALTSLLGWRSIFWVNIPIGLFATLWAHFRLRELAPAQETHKLDIGGNITFAAGLLILLIGITLNAISGLSVPITLLFVASAAILLFFFIKIEMKTEHPMFDFSLFRNRVFSAGNETIFLNSLSRGSFSLVMIFYLQGPLMLLDPLEAGIFLIPMSVSLSIMGPISGLLSDKFGYRIFVELGLLVSSLGFLMMTMIGTSLSWGQALIPLILIGSGMGLFASPNRSSIMNSVPINRRGVASGISTTLVNAGNTMSIGLAFLVMSIATPRLVLDSIFSGSTQVVGKFSASGFVFSVHLVFLLSAAMLFASMIIYAFVRDKPEYRHLKRGRFRPS